MKRPTKEQQSEYNRIYEEFLKNCKVKPDHNDPTLYGVP